MTDEPDVHLDATTFQHQLCSLANTIALKVEREGAKTFKPAFACADIAVMVRQSLHTFALLCLVNADEIRKGGYWKPGYSTAALPLIRCMIDCLYNITVTLTYPAKAYEFREVGYKRALEALDEDEQRYGTDPGWNAYIGQVRKSIRHGMGLDGTKQTEVDAATFWPSLNRYLKTKGKPITPHQEFLKKLTLGFWKEYSAIAHATFNGFMPTAMFYMPDLVPHENREYFDNNLVEWMIAKHLARAAGVLLCTLTEVQAEFRFDGARINQRLDEVWNALLLMPEIKELYDGRYAELIRMRGITPD